MMKKPDTMQVDNKSWKFKIDPKIFGFAESKMGVATLVTEIRNSVSQGVINGINSFFCMQIQIQES